MFAFLLILIGIACVFLVLFVLAQNPKGGGLSSTFGGATQIIGARQTADFLEKASWYLAIGILAVVLISNFFLPSGTAIKEKESKFKDQIDALPTNVPQSQSPNAAQKQVQQQGEIEATQPVKQKPGRNQVKRPYRQTQPQQPQPPPQPQQSPQPQPK